jgi:hypothetical protein
MSCIYCDEVASSKIASEKKVNNSKNPKLDEDLKVFVEFLETVAKKQKDINLSFLGGEVTYSKKFFYFVEQLLENDKHGKGDLWPQLESQLKQLYVAITRSCNRLIFIETKPSEIATRIFKYWTVRSSPLVVRYKPDTETFDLLTADESVKRGLDFVINAIDLENDDNDYNKILSWLRKALYYFERASRIDLVKRVVLKQKIILLLSKKSNEELERYQIENEHKVIGLIHECIMNDMHIEALALMQKLHNDSDDDHGDDDSSRYMAELIHKYKIVSSC